MQARMLRRRAGSGRHTVHKDDFVASAAVLLELDDEIHIDHHSELADGGGHVPVRGRRVEVSYLRWSGQRRLRCKSKKSAWRNWRARF